METKEFVKLTLDSIQQSVDNALKDLTEEDLNYQPGPESNSIGFTLWHQIRAEDSIINDMLANQPQEWITGKWYKKCNMSDDPQNSGFGYTPEQVASFVCPNLDILLDYGKAVRAGTKKYLDSLTPEKFDVEIEAPFGKMPVAGVLSLLIGEIAQHTGQIGYVRGLKKGFNK